MFNIKALIFAQYIQRVIFLMKTNSFDYISQRVLSKSDKSELLYTVAFFSKNLKPVKENYEIYNKELLTIIQYLKQS